MRLAGDSRKVTVIIPLALAAAALGGQLSVGQKVCPLDKVSQLPPDLPRKVHAPRVQPHVPAPPEREIALLPSLQSPGSFRPSILT